MSARAHTRVERRVRFDPHQIESEGDFRVEWDETDPDVEDIDAREAAFQECADRLNED